MKKYNTISGMTKFFNHQHEGPKAFDESEQKDLDKAIVFKGSGSDEELLRSENIENIDVFCALTNDDETNIMSAFLAKKLGAKKTLIILNNYSYINILPKSFVDLPLRHKE